MQLMLIILQERPLINTCNPCNPVYVNRFVWFLFESVRQVYEWSEYMLWIALCDDDDDDDDEE